MKSNIWILNHYAGSMYVDKGGRHYAIAKYLKENGYEPTIFCANYDHWKKEYFFGEETTIKIEQTTGVPYVFVNVRKYNTNKLTRILGMVDFYRRIKRIGKVYAKNHAIPDVIIASSVHPLTLLAGQKLAKTFGIKCICEIRDLWPESIVAYSTRFSRDNILIRSLYVGEKKLYINADHLVFTMEGAKEYIIDRHWQNSIPDSKISYINNGVDLEEFMYNRDHFRIEDTDLENRSVFKVVYAGSIKRVNNLGLLLDVAKCVKNSNVVFLIWGEGEEKDSLQQRIREERIANVFFKGRVDKRFIPYIISNADLNLAHNNPSELFKYGISFNKLFEYFAAGKPILSDFSCPHNPSIEFCAGTSVESANTTDIADEIDRFANMTDEEYSRYCVNASKAAQHYSYRNLVKQYIEIIEN